MISFFCRRNNLADWYSVLALQKIWAEGCWIVRDNFLLLSFLFLPCLCRTLTTCLFPTVWLLSSFSDEQLIAYWLQVSKTSGKSWWGQWEHGFSTQIVLCLSKLEVMHSPGILMGVFRREAWNAFLTFFVCVQKTITWGRHNEGIWMPGSGEKIYRNICICTASFI